jgi:hypothetical protein
MGVCIFKTSEVLRCVEHALISLKWDMGWANEEKPQPALFFVHDQGVYVMSNANPRDLLVGSKNSAYVAYAAGTNPEHDEDWWDNARDLVGGDDFAETLLINKNWLDDCAAFDELHIEVTANEIKCTFAKPKPASTNKKKSTPLT